MNYSISKSETARNLRYKRGILDKLNYEYIRDTLWDIEEAVSDVTYFIGDESTLIDALDGDEEEAYEFQMLFSDLSADCATLESRINDEYISESFDDFFTGIAFKGNLPFNILGYDSYENDYFSLTRYESELSASESGKRLKRLTKDELIAAAGQCFGLAVAFLDLEYKYDYLKATMDVLRGENGAILKVVKDIEKLYESMFYEDGEMRSDWSDQVRQFERLTEDLPQKLWIE